MAIEGSSGVILCVDGYRAYPYDVGNLQYASQCIQKQPGSNSTPLTFAMHGKACKNEKRDRMARHAFCDALRSIRMPDFTRDNRVISDRCVAAQADIGLW